MIFVILCSYFFWIEIFFPGGRREATSLKDLENSEDYRSQGVPLQGAHRVNSARGQEAHLQWSLSREIHEIRGCREIHGCSSLRVIIYAGWAFHGSTHALHVTPMNWLVHHAKFRWSHFLCVMGALPVANRHLFTSPQGTSHCTQQYRYS